MLARAVRLLSLGVGHRSVTFRPCARALDRESLRKYYDSLDPARPTAAAPLPGDALGPAAVQPLPPATRAALLDALGAANAAERIADLAARLPLDDARAAGHLLLRGEPSGGVAAAPHLAVAAYRAAADRGDAAARFALARCLRDGRGAPRDARAALRLFKALATAGHGWSQYALAQMVDAGEGAKADPALALELYRLAAERGIAPAFYNIATAYATGRGAPQDDSQARVWFERAAELGDPLAFCALAARAADASQAFEYYYQAARRGLARAQHNVAHMMLTGSGTTRNEADAEAMFRRAALQGFAASQLNLALMLLAQPGAGARQLSEAVDWLKSAAGQSDQQQVAAEARARLSELREAGFVRLGADAATADATR